MVDRTYRDDPQKFSRDLTRKITLDAKEEFEEWQAKGRLPAKIRLKNMFSRRPVKLRGKGG